ncbi:MAG: hypothetical protein WC462_00190 [archaeon]
MFDRNFDEPNYNPGGGNYDPNPQPGFSMPGLPDFDLKKYLPLIVITIIVLIAGFLILSWLGSQQAITIRLVDLENNEVQGKLIIKDKDGKILQADPKGTASSFKITLWPGDYKVSVPIADGYKAIPSKTLTIPLSSEVYKISLTRDLEATLTTNTNYSEIFDGQTINGSINVINSGNEFDIADIVPVDSNLLQITIQPSSTPTIVQGGSLFLDFNAKIKSNTKIKESQKTTITFKIIGTDITSKAIELQAMPSVAAADVKLNTTEIKNISLIAGKEETFTITITNNNKTIQLKNIKAELIPDEGSEETLNWFRFAQPDSESNYIKTISTIDPTKPETIKLYLNSPLSAKIGEEFKGSIRITSLSIKESKTINVNMIIKTEKTISLEINGLDKAFTIICSKQTGTCTPKSLSSEEVFFKNKGNIDISNITVLPDYASPATTNCFQYLSTISTKNTTDTTKINIIKAGATEPLIIDLTAPEEAPDKDFARCIIKWTYLDPLQSPAQIISDSKVFEINKSIR